MEEIDHFLKDAEDKPLLPEDFHEKILDLENQITLNKSIEIIEQLTTLYKQGAEYYSGSNKTKQQYFITKLQDLYLDKKNLKVIETHTKQNFLPRVHNSSNDLAIVEEKIENEEEKSTQVEPSTNEEEIPSKKRASLKRFHTISVKNPMNLNFNRNRQATIVHKNEHHHHHHRQPLKRKTTISQTVKPSSEEMTLNEVIKSSKELVDSFEAYHSLTKKLAEGDVKQQSIRFRERYRNRKMIHLRTEAKKRDRAKRNSTPFLEINSDFISFLNTERKISDEVIITPKKRHSLFNSFLISAPSKAFNLSLKTQSKIIKYKKKTLTINEMFEDFTNKFHYIFFQNLIDSLFHKVMQLLNNNYHDKLIEYFKIEDQIKEMNLMFSDNDDYNDQLNLMILDLETQRDDIINPMEVEKIKRINEISNIGEWNTNIEFQDKMSKIIDDLINNVINILK